MDFMKLTLNKGEKWIEKDLTLKIFSIGTNVESLDLKMHSESSRSKSVRFLCNFHEFLSFFLIFWGFFHFREFFTLSTGFKFKFFTNFASATLKFPRKSIRKFNWSTACFRKPKKSFSDICQPHNLAMKLFNYFKRGKKGICI